MFKLVKIHERKIYLGMILFFFSLNFIIWQEVFALSKKADLTIYFFDVGQGDSILIEAKDGAQILIDGGPGGKVLSDLSAVLPYFDRSLDAIILTHPHADHVSGLLEVLKKYGAGAVLESGANYETPEAREFENMIEKKNINKIIVVKPMSLSFFNGAKLKFIFPDRSYEGANLKNVHDAALVSELEFEGRKILFMADAEEKTEKHLVSFGILEDVDVLKIGHHGSKTSSKVFFLDKIKPEYAVISAGRKNRYGHPAAETLAHLAAAGAKVFRTDLEGTIVLEIRGGEMVWKK